VPDFNDAGAQSQRYDVEDLALRLADRADEWVPAPFPSIVGDELRLANISGDPPRNNGSCAPAAAPARDRLAYGFDEFCRLVSIGRSLGYGEIAAGRLRVVRVGRRRRRRQGVAREPANGRGT
jgi:hypothetical protein